MIICNVIQYFFWCLIIEEYEITSTKDSKLASNSEEKKLPKTIEEYEEQESKEAELLSLTGTGSKDRKTPVYTMNYQQSVSAEDVFLQVMFNIYFASLVSS